MKHNMEMRDLSTSCWEKPRLLKGITCMKVVTNHACAAEKHTGNPISREFITQSGSVRTKPGDRKDYSPRTLTSPQGGSATGSVRLQSFLQSLLRRKLCRKRPAGSGSATGSVSGTLGGSAEPWPYTEYSFCWMGAPVAYPERVLEEVVPSSQGIHLLHAASPCSNERGSAIQVALQRKHSESALDRHEADSPPMTMHACT